MGLHGGGRTDDVSYCLHDGHGHWKPGGMESVFAFKSWMLVKLRTYWKKADSWSLFLFILNLYLVRQTDYLQLWPFRHSDLWSVTF